MGVGAFNSLLFYRGQKFQVWRGWLSRVLPLSLHRRRCVRDRNLASATSHGPQDARSVRIRMGASRKNRAGHLDDVAAAVLLQSYLDSQNP